MKKIFIVGNWKSNKTVEEAEEWFKQVASSKQQVESNIETVICPPFTCLPIFCSLLTINCLLPNFTLGAQDVSPFPDGAYTGEISARMLKDLGVRYVMIGHSERRKYFKEDDQLLANKVKEVLDSGLIPIYCVQGPTTPIPEGVKIILYEPSGAIGTGIAGSPQEANEIAKTLREISGSDTIILYGGSVSSENVSSFCQQKNINGVAVGNASLDPNKFLEIIKNASNL
ncbi:MAG: triose-phosphate isomerase family protein [Candidatus Gottesmanbacteria bacterium]